MSFRKFGQSDVLLNTMRAHPTVDFFIYSGKIYYNDNRHESGSFSGNILGITASFVGGLSLYEYNIDRLTGSNNPIFPYISKDSSGASFKTVTATGLSSEFQYGDRIDGFYPMTSSISRELMAAPAGHRQSVTNTGTGLIYPGTGAPTYPHFYALKNRLGYYSSFSEHYKVSSSYESGWDKSEQTINMISVPSIFYGSKINPGTVKLQWYVSGTLAAELNDTKENGELIETTGLNKDLVAGVVLYNEGIILLTGSWDIDSTELPLLTGRTGGGDVKPKWIYFGAGGNDAIDIETAEPAFASASFGLHFQASTVTQVCTMFAKARRGEVNYSNNPTFIAYNQDYLRNSGSTTYEENPNRKIKNTASSSYASHNESFKRQVYISRVAIYDDSKNLIAVATLADPVLKEEEQDITFKLKLDI